MQIQCKNSGCGHSYEVFDTAAAQTTCPRCGTVQNLAPTPSPAGGGGVSIPPYVHVPGITDPNLQQIPPLDSFQGLNTGERVIKSYQIRVRKPNVPIVLLLIIPILLALPVAFLWQQSLIDDAKQRAIRRTMEKRLKEEYEYRDRPYYYRPYISDYDDEYWREKPGEGTMFKLTVLIAAIFMIAGFGLFVLFQLRGHTFLYLTDQRIIVLELEQGRMSRAQTVCSFSINDVAGFQLMAQRGISKLFGLLKLGERRTFYLSIVTKTSASFTIGAITAARSNFTPGRDAVALCGELDAQVLALRAPS